ncbi:protein kinase [Micromonospora sp. NPDC049460]|uniref:methylation-associated defense system protein kinase MAD6 n=1 Tax=Micromonospora sp. NPDC049460 TaxID=3364272 RepID=UPI00378A4065
MAQIVGGGPPVNDAERKVVALLRDHAPDDWSVLHNIEVRGRAGIFEVDLVVITPHAVWLVDVKGTSGRIEVAGARWYPSGRDAFGSPAAKLRQHARVVADLLRRQHSALNRVYVGALVVLTADNAKLIDPVGNDAEDTVTLPDLIDALGDPTRVRTGFPRDVRGHHAAIITALHGIVDLPTGPQRFGNWEVRERLGGDDVITEYRAVNSATRHSGDSALLRVYRADPFLPEEERRAEERQISNAYDALTRMGGHPCVVGRRDFFPIEDGSAFVLVLDDVAGQPLRTYLDNPRAALAADAKLRVVVDVLRGLTHAHRNRVVHRALSPTTVLVTESGRGLLTGFDYARPAGPPRDPTVLRLLADALDEQYVAPECQAHPEKMTTASDVYAAGVIAYRVLTGELPFTSSTDQFERGSILPDAPMAEAGLPTGLSALLKRMCARAPSGRPSADEALDEMQAALGRRRKPPTPPPAAPAGSGGADEPDFWHLPEGYPLTPKYTVRRRLGRGQSSVAYQVYDDLAGADRAVKLVLRDRESVIERLRHEYKILIGLPPHPNVVKVEVADYLHGRQIPYLAFEYVEGQDVKTLLADKSLGPADAVALAADVARGLLFLHQHGVYHCDIKPANLYWSERGAKIIDFNIALHSESTLSPPGGTPRYVAPDLRGHRHLDQADLADRDVYALGVTLYELLTGGGYPWDAAQPVPGEPPRDPRSFIGLGDLADPLAEVVRRAIAPRRSDRYGTAERFLAALHEIREVRTASPPPPVPEPAPETTGANPFVDYLQTLYSQSVRSNAGTRGKDTQKLYVETALDDRLRPAVLSGDHDLVIITGNAGDGKTAFLERLAEQAAERGAVIGPPRSNGVDFQLPGGRWCRINYDGSQDEGDTTNDEVLQAFFAPFIGADATAWPQDETRLIAINEGRLVDFLSTEEKAYPKLADLVRAGLRGEPTPARTVVVNLNRRSLLAPTSELQESIFDRLLIRLTDERYWSACGGCALERTCYARHNALTFAHPTAGPQIRERLRDLYRLADLRGRLHMTMRDLRSAFAYMLTSGRDCASIHQLYAANETETILDSYYFTSYAGPSGGQDRLLRLLREVDLASAPAPALDRQLDYLGPAAGRALVTVDGRGDQDQRLLARLAEHLTRSSAPDQDERAAHRRYVAAARRRFYFESLDQRRSRNLLPYRGADRLLTLLKNPESVGERLDELVDAINRSEGLTDPRQLGDVLALRLRQVPGETIRSYRLFPKERLALSVSDEPSNPYLEGQPDAVVLRYHGEVGHRAQLRIRLDLFELLHRLGVGYLPGEADQQGLYLGLTIFKNELSAAPYQEILLASALGELSRVRREPGGLLVMHRGEATGGR